MDKKRLILGIAAVGICFLAGVLFATLYQTDKRTMKIYSQAMQDYANGDYQNSYYLFSKIGYLSNLKPFAIYHQAQCANKLNDKKSEIKQYQLLYKSFKKNDLSIRAKYLEAQLLIEENPTKAKKYFSEIIKNYPNTDYAIASEYYLGVILLNKYKNNPNQIIPASDKNNIEMAFRHYLTKAPQGKLALNAVNNWLSLDKEISADDYLVMANTYFMFDDYENTRKLLNKSDLKDSWMLESKTAYALKDYPRVKLHIQYGLGNHADNLDEKDIKDMVDMYLAVSNSKTDAIDLLYDISGHKDYVWSLKCEKTPAKQQPDCYRNLYLTYPNSTYGADAMAKLFFFKVKDRDYISASKIGKDYLGKFSDKLSAPFVMFWMGKIAEKQNKYEEYMYYYKNTIAKFPDTYYAYRAYLAMKHIAGPLFQATITKELPVEYPYELPKNHAINKLIKLKDYELIDLIRDDKFVKSWLAYQNGNYSHSMLLARDAMEETIPKPSKNDLRWRLVYPIHYFNEINTYSQSNNPVLMLALIREESFFNPDAQSSVGARGLMQIMPSTAQEINGVSAQDLFNPITNIKTGNLYYSRLRSNLNGSDISSIVAYNGGIGSINRWKQNLTYSDTDEFVEQIPYFETRNYVRKVYRSYWNYLRVYINN